MTELTSAVGVAAAAGGAAWSWNAVMKKAVAIANASNLILDTDAPLDCGWGRNFVVASMTGPAGAGTQTVVTVFVPSWGSAVGQAPGGGLAESSENVKFPLHSSARGSR